MRVSTVTKLLKGALILKFTMIAITQGKMNIQIQCVDYT